jgi:Phosphodiester glycosidase
LRTAALALAAGLLLAAPAHAADKRSVKRVAPGLTWTHIVRSAGPERINVLTIDRAKLGGRLGSVLSNSKATGAERLSAMARRTRARAGVNGGFFGVDGNPVGVLDVGGRLVSEPVGGRSALLVPAGAATRLRVAELKFAGAVVSGNRKRLLDGVDRRPGRIPACGGRGGDRPTTRANGTLTCTDSSELVLFDDRNGARTPAGGTEAVVRDGVADAPRRSGGTKVPRGGYVLWGSGNAATFLRQAVPAGARPQLDLALRSGSRALQPDGYAAIVGGGPRLLRNGLVRLGSVAEGFGVRSFFNAFVLSRAPRTLAGVRSDGRLLLVTIDGRRRGWSAGMTLFEAARLMLSLGARDALNLDGGGSSTMTVGLRVVSRPSDRAGERPVSDGLLVLP